MLKRLRLITKQEGRYWKSSEIFAEAIRKRDTEENSIEGGASQIYQDFAKAVQFVGKSLREPLGKIYLGISRRA